MVRFSDVRFLLPPPGGACLICHALADLLGEEERSERAEVSAVNNTHETSSPTPDGTAKPPCPPRVSVVIPARNEARNLPFVLSRLPAGLFEVILVDGHSDDDTVGVATRCRADIRVVCQRGHGKGNALACGFAAARGEVIVALDADGSTDPAEIPRFVQALRRGADFAKGSRFAPGGGSADITTLRKGGNLALVRLVNVLFRTRYTDLCYGFNAFWAKCLPMLEANCDGFEVETLLNLRAARSGLKVAEVPSFERPRLHGLSNLRAWPDGLRVLRTVLSEYLSPHLHQAVQWSELGEWSELAQWSELGWSEPGPEPVAQGIADRAKVSPRGEAAAPVRRRAAWTSR
jgi:Glycosyl transferase family 2